MKRVFLALALALTAQGCADISPYRYTQVYTMIEPEPDAGKVYSDGKITVRFHVGEKRLFFRLENHTKEPAAINWDKAAYVHMDGARHEVAGLDAIFTPNRTKPGVTEIAPGKATDDFAAPIKNVEKLEEWTWYLYPLFNLFDEGAMENKGKVFGLDLPIRVEGEWKVYQFRFRVLNVIPITRRV